MNKRTAIHNTREDPFKAEDLSKESFMLGWRSCVVLYALLATFTLMVGCSGPGDHSIAPHVGQKPSSGDIPESSSVKNAPRIVSFRNVPITQPIVRRLLSGGTVGDVAALDGQPWGPLGWNYAGANLDPSCGSLTWTFTDTIPGASITWNPNPPATTLTGTEQITVNIPTGTPPGSYPHAFVTGHCTNPNHTGNAPGGTDFTIGVVTLDIVDIPDGKSTGSVVTNTTSDHIVGQSITLFASPQPAATLSNIRWTVSGGKKIKSYSQTTSSAVVTNLASTDLQQQLLKFFWYGGTVVGITNDATVQADFPVNWSGFGTVSLPSALAAKFNVLAPTNVSMTTTTGDIDVGPYPFQTPPATPQPAISFGARQLTDYGISFNYTATSPKGGSGLISMTQLTSLTTTLTPPGCATISTTGGAFELDTSVHYANHTVGIGDNSAAAWTETDSPAVSLTVPCTSEDVNSYQFQDYFAYQPAGPNSIWVTIGELNWNWHGQANYVPATQTWALAPGSGHSTNPSGSTSTKLPLWSGVY